MKAKLISIAKPEEGSRITWLQTLGITILSIDRSTLGALTENIAYCIILLEHFNKSSVNMQYIGIHNLYKHTHTHIYSCASQTTHAHGKHFPSLAVILLRFYSWLSYHADSNTFCQYGSIVNSHMTSFMRRLAL